MFTANGDLNVGKGKKSAASFPPLSLIWDPDGYSRVNGERQRRIPFRGKSQDRLLHPHRPRSSRMRCRRAASAEPRGWRHGSGLKPS